MISDYRCIYCLVTAFGRSLEKAGIPVCDKEGFTKEMIGVLNEKWNTVNAPDCARDIHGLYRKYIKNEDPFREVKRKSNDTVMQMSGELEQKIRNSEDPFTTALKLAIAGNIIDFAVNDNCDLEGTIEKVLNSDFAVDHSAKLREELKKAGKVLYIGDNAGEIVFDKLFIREIAHHDLTYSVRGAPVINDATMEDAEYTGLTSMVKVISSEYDAPSTILEKSGEEFRTHFEKADVIISKGQGNLEGLIGESDPRIFFLLMVKCEVMAEFMNTETGSYVVWNPGLVRRQ
jgi:uncharacterized protein with ATP-grasp and redox domains